MEINIKRNIKGAMEAEGLVVIIDVFRAFSTIYYVFDNNATQVIPVGKNETALEMKKENPDYIILGESIGVKVEGFDYGNSPYEIKDVDFKDKDVLLRTSRGTMGLTNVNNKNAEDVIVGSFVGISAIVRYIQYKNPEKVTLVCMGDPGDREALEDELCAKCIKESLENKVVDYSKVYELIKTSPCSERFFDDKVTHTPREDFDLCMAIDRFDFVVRYDLEKKSLYKTEVVRNQDKL